ncbi:MAG: low molecular weight protein-tyrosine-phosphatase [Anaerolineales bacterium]
MADKTKILFVCLGNIVRSPLAENIFRQLADEANLGYKYQVDSAGTGAWHVGEAPDSRMVRVAAQHGMQYTGRARQIARDDLEKFDLLVVMDRDNRAVLYNMMRGIKQQSKIHMLREFDPQAKIDAEVPDPYYGGSEGFERVYQIVRRSCEGLLNSLENGNLTL